MPMSLGLVSTQMWVILHGSCSSKAAVLPERRSSRRDFQPCVTSQGEVRWGPYA